MKINYEKQLTIFCVDMLSVKDTVISCSVFIEKIRVVYKAVGMGLEDVEKKLNRAFDILFEEVLKIKNKF